MPSSFAVFFHSLKPSEIDIKRYIAAHPTTKKRQNFSTADDAPESKHLGSSHMGKGAAVKGMDGSIVCAPELVEKLMQLAEKNKIACQRDVITAGGTDAGNIYLSREGVKASGVSVPCRYTHSPQETVSIADVEATAALLAAFCEAKL